MNKLIVTFVKFDGILTDTQHMVIFDGEPSPDRLYYIRTQIFPYMVDDLVLTFKWVSDSVDVSQVSIISLDELANMSQYSLIDKRKVTHIHYVSHSNDIRKAVAHLNNGKPISAVLYRYAPELYAQLCTMNSPQLRKLLAEGDKYE